MIAPFDPTAPLPPGITVLEASAGTGKTYAIAGLVARCVAEGVRLPRILVVTFTRMATAELRDRVRRRLVDAAAHLEAALAGVARETDDLVLRWLAAADAGTVAQRYARIQEALAEFDAATVATIHGFCQQVLAGIGLAADVDPAATFLDNPTELVSSVVDDLVVRRFAGGAGPALTRDIVAELARAVAANPDAVIVPADDGGSAEGEALVALRSEVAAEVRHAVERRKRTGSLVSYDDLLTRLAATLRDPERGPAARRRLQARFDVALVDEFQDTDPVQWEIVAEAFGRDGKRLVLIGDPKQAIYAFRGADVHAYLDAVRRAQHRATLDTNWRSDGPLLDAYNVLFTGATLGDAEIAYRPVQPAGAHRDARLVGAPVSAPLRLRVVRRDGDLRQTPKGFVQVDAAREHIARDVAGQIVALLDSGARIVEPAALPAPAGQRERRVAPPDVAVLVRTNAEASQVQGALRQAGVPAVINGVGSVFATPAATDWQRLLEALERPGDRARARAVAVTAFFGWTGEQIAGADDQAWDQLHADLHRWAEALRGGNVAAVQRAIAVAEAMPARLLAQPDGERRVVDLEHIGELLHAAVAAEDLGPTALASWLQEQIADATDDTAPDERSRRLESDAAAVQVLTVHRSKGLEFPIVFAPFMWSRRDDAPRVPVVHDQQAGRRVIDVAGTGAAWKDRQQQDLAESRWEELRLLYVALTRARHQVVVWWAPGHNSANAPLTRVLLCRRRNGDVVNAPNVNPQNITDEAVAERLATLVELGGGTIAVEPSAEMAALPRWTLADPEPVALAAARFDRGIDHSWRRTSYSALTAVVHEAAPAIDTDETVTDDEPDLTALRDAGPSDAGALDAEAALRAVASPLADLPGGAEFGSFVHAVLEDADFSAEDLRAEILGHVEAQQGPHHVDIGDPAVLAEGLCRAIETPLGPLVADVRLRDVSRAHRLDELAFELPLATVPSGSGTGGHVSVAAIGALLRAHLPAGDPLAGYADRLGDPSLRQQVRGFLTGSIDAVLRLPDGRFAVVDYKTNWLGSAASTASSRGLAAPAAIDPAAPAGSAAADATHSPLSAWDYRPTALVTAMERSHYPLQALLYAVALHRYLRWRLPAYDPDAHLAGVLYLFLRGMTGADVPRVRGQPCGVFAWRPPTALVEELSGLLDRGEAAA